MTKFLHFIVITALLLSTTISCKNKNQASPTTNDTININGITDGEALNEDNSNIDSIENNNSEELFYDFVFDFMSNAKFQLKRIAPQLAETWKYDPIFIHHDVYTTLFDEAKEQSLIDSCHINKAAVEMILPDQIHIKRYEFERYNGYWRLYAVIEKEVASQQKDFLQFLIKFVSNPSYRTKHIDSPFQLQIQNPDTYEMVIGTAYPSQWDDFAPIIQPQELTNIDYGQQFDKSDTRYVIVSSIDGSVTSNLVFKKKKGTWYLVRLENN